MQERQAPPKSTVEVPVEAFREVYDSPAALPGAERWTTRDEDVRGVEELLGLPAGSIGAPLWVSGDQRHCPGCDREVSWLDIVSSALREVHSARLVAEVILGDRKFVNVEAPRAIAHLRCASCGSAIEGIRSFKCHNWAYAHGALERVLQALPDQPPR